MNRFGQNPRLRAIFGLAFVVFAWASSPAIGQTCEGVWDPTVGDPGLQSDNAYAAAMLPWTDSNGEALFISGTFTKIGGVLTNNIIRWDPATDTWTKLGKGCYSKNTNSFIASLAVFDPGDGESLFVGGWFGTANDVSGTANLARWDGAKWRAVGTVNGAVWALATWQGKLYIGGGFSKAGGVTANGIASWDGSNWEALGAGMSGGYSPAVFALHVFDDGSGEKLYAGGRFDKLGGIQSAVACWDGSAWSKPGDGLRLTDTFGDIEAMTLLDDGNGPALFVGGAYFRPVGGSQTNVARWDGQSWTEVGQYLGGRTTGLAAFDDGSGMKLYNGGTAQPDIQYLARLEDDSWVAVDGGVGGPEGPPWPSVFGLRTWRDRLYVGGSFAWVGADEIPAGGLAAIWACVPGDLNCSGGVDFDDIDPFVLSLSDPAGYESQYPNCNIARGDINGDGSVDFDDIDPFVECIANGGCL